MRVLLIDVDSQIPNLALMKISAFHKLMGDYVSFREAAPDLVYASIVFRRNQWKAGAIQKMFPSTPVLAGGAGVDLQLWLPKIVEELKPDYDLYPSTYSMGYTTRGCPRRCYFCIVPKKEGPLVRWQHPEQFHDSRFSTIMLLDNNWLGDPEWFFETSNWIIEHDLKLWKHGLDIRLVTPRIARQLLRLRMVKDYHFAFDFDELEPIIEKKLRLLERAGFSVRSEVMFYVYVHGDSQFTSGLRRARLLKKWGTNAFIMFNAEAPRTRRIKALQHWANRKQLFHSCDFNEYYQREGSYG